MGSPESAPDVSLLIHELALGVEETRWVNVRLSLLSSSFEEKIVDNIEHIVYSWYASFIEIMFDVGLTPRPPGAIQFQVSLSWYHVPLVC